LFSIAGAVQLFRNWHHFFLDPTLTESGVSVFVISTFDTDYLMVKERNLAKAIDVLTAEGHRVMAEV